jgi:hypothetical protein
MSVTDLPLKGGEERSLKRESGWNGEDGGDSVKPRNLILQVRQKKGQHFVKLAMSGQVSEVHQGLARIALVQGLLLRCSL